jgi:hypothetical protein
VQRDAVDINNHMDHCARISTKGTQFLYETEAATVRRDGVSISGKDGIQPTVRGKDAETAHGRGFRKRRSPDRLKQPRQRRAGRALDAR